MVNDEFLNDHSTILSLSDSLLKYWVFFLFTLIMNCLAHLNNEFRFNIDAVAKTYANN